MKTFVAIFTGTADSMARFQSLPQAERQRLEAEGMKAWGQWMERHKDSLVDGGAPLGRTKRVSAEGITDIRNAIGAYTIVRAESHDSAARMFLGHPHFTIFPGDGVEIMERLPIPGG